MLDPFVLLLALLIGPPVPIWVSAWVAPALRLVVAPAGRMEFAATTTDPARHILRALRLRLFVAHAPAILAGVAAALIAGKWANSELSNTGHFGRVELLVAFISVMAGMYAIMADRFATASLWLSAANACERGQELAIPYSIVHATGRSLLRGGAAVLLVSGVVVIMDFLATGPNGVGKEIAGLCGVFASAAICVVAHRGERLAWRKLVAAYPERDPHSDSPPLP